MLGLLHAVREYRPEHESGAKFFTFAYRCVWTRIKRFCQQGIIHVPANFLCRTDEGVEDDLDAKFDSACRMAYRKAIQAKEFSVVGDEFRDIPEGSITVSETEWEESLDEVKKALRILSDKRREVMILRSGLGEDREEKTLQEIGDLYGNSRERMRQLEESSIAKLRNWLMETDLKTYDAQVARSKMFSTNLVPHPVNGTADSVAPAPREEKRPF